MPLYFFNVQAGECEETDIVGRRCRDDLEALSTAMEVAAEVLRARLEDGGVSDAGAVTVEDERHRPVLTLPLRAAAY